MCANFKPLKKEHSYQLDLLEPTFDYKSDVYPSDDCPIILSHQNEWEWRKVKFGMLPPYAKEVSFNMQLIMQELKRLITNVHLNMPGQMINLA